MAKFAKLIDVGNKFDAGWQLDLDSDDRQELEDIAYILLVEANGFHLAKVDAWSNIYELITGGTSRRWTLRFSHVRGFASHATELLSYCDKPLNYQEIDRLDSLVTAGLSRPVVNENLGQNLSIDMEEARAAVARYYHLSPKQIQITIKSSGEIH